MNKPNKTRSLAALTLGACMSWSVTSQAAESPREPAVVIAALSDRIYALGETTGKAEDMAAAEIEAGKEIRAYVASGASTGLLAKEKGRQSPLAMAAYLGYPNVVAALLSSDTVKPHVNDVDENGMTPWTAATLSLRQSIPACNPSVADNPFALVPLLVTQPYYVSNPAAPYKKTRELLVQAGASADVQQAKQVWSQLCKNQAAEGKEKVRNSADLQKTVQELGWAELNGQLLKLQKKMQNEQGRHAK